MSSHRVEEARKAYRERDLEISKKAHERARIREEAYHKRFFGEYIGNFVYGSLDGIVTTFAVVAGATGAALSPGIILILGFANLLGDGVSMALGNYLSTKSELEYVEAERAREEWEIENIPEGEKDELRQLYAKKGFEDPLLGEIIDTITSDRKRWIDTMMLEELNIVPQYKSPTMSALTTLMSFVGIGVIPLLAFISSFLRPALWEVDFQISILLTALAIFIAGSARSLVTGKKWHVAGAEMLLVGAMAAGVAYVVGLMLGKIA
jgi:VIT1/CCC1 family predicted Fe2+/Mn2+ transporter